MKPLFKIVILVFFFSPTIALANGGDSVNLGNADRCDSMYCPGGQAGSSSPLVERMRQNLGVNLAPPSATIPAVPKLVVFKGPTKAQPAPPTPVPSSLLQGATPVTTETTDTGVKTASVDSQKRDQNGNFLEDSASMNQNYQQPQLQVASHSGGLKQVGRNIYRDD